MGKSKNVQYLENSWSNGETDKRKVTVKAYAR